MRRVRGGNDATQALGYDEINDRGPVVEALFNLYQRIIIDDWCQALLCQFNMDLVKFRLRMGGRGRNRGK